MSENTLLAIMYIGFLLTVGLGIYLYHLERLEGCMK